LIREGQSIREVWRRREMHTGIMVGTSEVKKALGNPRCKREDNIKLCVKK
jgi:hypothetical protein